MKNECDIVKDLLNSYDEGILSETSKKFVENHLATCKSCKQILKEIKKQNNTASTQEIDYLKKIRKKISIKNIITTILVIIIALLILLDALLFFNYYKKISVINQTYAIIDNLKLNAEKYENLDNYSYTLTDKYSNTNNETVRKYYVLGNAFVSEVIRYTDEGNEVHEYAYYPGKDDIVYVNREGQKSILTYNGKKGGIDNIPSTLTSAITSLAYDHNYIIKVEEYTENNKNYYILTNAHMAEYIVEKYTGIIVKSISDNFTYSIEYEIGNVTNEDIDRIANILNVDENTTLREYLG